MAKKILFGIFCKNNVFFDENKYDIKYNYIIDKSDKNRFKWKILPYNCITEIYYKKQGSKWEVFFDEFLSHLKNLSGDFNMKDENIKTLLANASYLWNANELYPNFINDTRDKIYNSINKKYHEKFTQSLTNDQNNSVLRFYHQNSQDNIALFIDKSINNLPFSLHLYLHEDTRKKIYHLKESLNYNYKKYWKENNGKWHCYLILKDEYFNIDRILEKTLDVAKFLENN